MVVTVSPRLVTRLSTLVTASLVAFNWLPFTASVLVSLSSPAATLVTLFGPVPPWLALNAPAPASHNKASLLKTPSAASTLSKPLPTLVAAPELPAMLLALVRAKLGAVSAPVSGLYVAPPPSAAAVFAPSVSISASAAIN
ncbi:hypothetical protein D3C76_714950 [compost metagenome]